MGTAKKAAFFKLREDILDDLRTVANAEDTTMTSIIEDALDLYLPKTKQKIFAEQEQIMRGLNK